MFGFFKKNSGPTICPSNPGVGAKVKVAFANGERTWSEEVDVVSLAAAVFKQHGYKVVNNKSWLDHAESGFKIVPQFVSLQPLDSGGAQTVTTMQSNHPTLLPHGLFEYQHAIGNSVTEAISQGIDQWVQTDFVTLLEALQPKLERCTVMKMTFPAKDGRPARTRRAVLGPVAHYMQNRQSKAPVTDSEEHPFCPCCLLTRSFEAFKELFEEDGFYGLRLFAARNPDGSPEADCRVNGDDWNEGAKALREYVLTWPGQGYEFRKQYVVLQSVAAGDSLGQAG